MRPNKYPRRMPRVGGAVWARRTLKHPWTPTLKRLESRSTMISRLSVLSPHHLQRLLLLPDSRAKWWLLPKSIRCQWLKLTSMNPRKVKETRLGPSDRPKKRTYQPYLESLVKIKGMTIGRPTMISRVSKRLLQLLDLLRNKRFGRILFELKG